MSSSKRWLQEHFNDHYVRQAQSQGYPSRAAYKLLELQQKDQLIRPGMTILDLGAAPGGWSMVAKQLVGVKGRVIAVDCLAMEPLSGVEFIQGDFTDEAILAQVLNIVDNKSVDIVISDMAPNMSGCKLVDQCKLMNLAELAWDCATKVLVSGGHLVIKLFQGSGVDQFVQELRPCFKRVHLRKPNASRARSAEIYLLAYSFIHT